MCREKYCDKEKIHSPSFTRYGKGLNTQEYQYPMLKETSLQFSTKSCENYLNLQNIAGKLRKYNQLKLYHRS